MDPTRSSDRWSGIIGTGQSLGVGIQAGLPGMTAPVPHALKLHDPAEPWQARYNIDQPDNPALHVVPLNEPIHAVHPDAQPPLAYPWNIAGKTPHTSMAEQITAMLKERGQAPVTTVHTCVARSGEAMVRIRKAGGTNSYKASMYEAKALTRIAKQEKQRLEYDAIIMTHGETDAGFGNQEYEQQLFSFHDDYIKDLQAITGQRHPPVLIMSQQNTCPTDPRDIRPSPVIQAQWRAQLKAPKMMICAGPKYQYGYHQDGLHFAEPSYNRLGEKYGEVYFRTVIEGQHFLPVSPREVVFEAPQTINVKLNVPNPPLRWDDRLWPPHQDHCQEWKRGRGFEVRNSHGKMVEIKGVRIGRDGASVTIQLASEMKHFPLQLGYAMMLDAHNTNGGRPGGRVGHLCDSDQLVGVGAERIKVRATQGSNKLQCGNDGFHRRAKFDLIESGHFAIVGFEDRKNIAVLDRAWDGQSGEFDLFFQHNHANYCVSFAVWVRKDGFSFDADAPLSSSSASTMQSQSMREKLMGAGKSLFHSVS